MSHKVCRLCLLGQEGSVLTPIFGNPSLPELPGKLQKCLPFKIHLLDNHPKHICFRCLAQIDIVYEFLRNAIYADGYWKKLDKKQPHTSSTSFQRILGEPATRHESLPLAKRPCLEPQVVFCDSSSSEDSEDDDIVLLSQDRWQSTRPSPQQQQHMVIEQHTQDTHYSMAQDPSDEEEHDSEEPTVKARQRQVARKDCKTEVVPPTVQCSGVTTKKEECSQTESDTAVDNPSLMNQQPTDYTFPGFPLKFQGTDKPQMQFMYSYPPLGFPWYQFMPGGYPVPPQMLAMPSTSQNYFPMPTMQVAPPRTMSLTSTEPPQTSECVEESAEHAEEEEMSPPKKVPLIKPNVEVQKPTKEELNNMKVKSPHTPKNKVKISSKQSTPGFFSEQYYSDVNFCTYCNEILCPNINLFEHMVSVHSKKDN